MISKSALATEEGSISPLILGYFIFIMLAIFLVSDVAHVYIERRSLISEGESALMRSAQELDEFSYYYGNSIIPPLGRDSFADQSSKPWRLRVPIDCAQAKGVFFHQLSVDISVDSFGCDGYELRATISNAETLPFQLKILRITSFTNRVEIGVSSHFE